MAKDRMAAEEETVGFSTIEDAIAAIGRGELVIVVDDPSRENEGDFVIAADRVTPEAINFMVTHGRGLVCMPLDPERLNALRLPQMVSEQTDMCAFTLSIDLRSPRNTGISAYDRARCISRAVAPDAKPSEFTTPGHVFPLRAKPGGVLERRGHTEAAIDLARLAGLSPAGVVCEILNPDGTMARLPDLREVASRHGLHLITIADLVAYRLRTELLIERRAEARIPTAFGVFTAIGYASAIDGREHLALTYGRLSESHAPLVRLHSECLTGDVFGSIRCDCGAQLEEAMRAIAVDGAGAIVYVRGHEGRGIGLLAKLEAYALQDCGADTVEANVALGFAPDERDYAAAGQILRNLGLSRVRLMTNNPAKVDGLAASGIDVAERIPLETAPTTENLRYLQTKRDRLHHQLALERLGLAYA